MKGKEKKEQVKKTKEKKKNKVKIINEGKVVKKEKNIKLKFNSTILVIILITCGVLGLGYYFLGLIPTIILLVGCGLIILIGSLFDKSKTKTKRRKVLKTIIMVILSLGVLGLLASIAFMIYIVKTAPDFATELLKEKESTVLYDSNGNEFAKLGTAIRENIEYSDLSEVFIDALIATEDSRFFQHNGFDLMRFSKAIIGQLLGQDGAGGGSTLTMQVAKNTFTDAKLDTGIKGIIRKFTDIYISIFQLEKNYTKEEIIEFYVNNHNLGGSIYGVQEASQHFFGKDAKDLNLSEAALVAGLYQAPTYYNPFNNPENATKRRSTVLYLMVRHGYITAEERKLAESIPVSSLLVNTNTSTNAYQGYIDTVCKEVQKKYGVDPYTVPMLIYTNMDIKKQNGLNDILNGKTFGWKDDLIQTGIVALDSNTGKIVAIGTGRNRNKAKSFNYATGINRQIGSTAKPLFDYGPGIEYNNWSTYTLFNDERGYTYSNGKPISNFDGNFEGIITLRRALSNSRNIPALKAFQQVDNKKIIDYVTKIGITPEISNGYIHEAHAIGAFTGSNPLAMAGAYQIYSNGGYYYEPYSVSKVVFRSTGETIEYSSPKVKAISDSTSYMITDVLKMVPKYITKVGLSNDYFAAKTGTTNVSDDIKKSKGLPSSIVRDYWIMGYTHDITIGIWIGYDDLSKTNYLNYNTDGNMRHYLLNAVGKVCFNHDNVDFTQPKSVVRSAVEVLSDPPKLPSASTPGDQIVTELFKRGTEPTEVSRKYLVLNTPTNFKVKYRDNAVNLSWNTVSDLGYVTNGVMGYYVYFNNEKLYFTENNYIVINNLTSYLGTYSVRAGYQDTNDALSNAANYTLETTDTYDLSIVGDLSSQFYVGEIIDPYLYNGSKVKLLINDVAETNLATISTTITDSSGKVVTEIDTSTPNTYTVTYKVTHNKFTGTCSNKIIINEIE